MQTRTLSDVTTFGAIGDGKTDCTAAIQKALDAAAESRGSVVVPPGTYLTGRLKMHPYTGIMGYPTWSFREFGGSILRLADSSAPCLLDITGAYGATVHGLCLDGDKLGEKIHGVMIDKGDYGKTEDTPRLERCRIEAFTGDGVHFGRVWCFSIRHCMISHNARAGLSVRGWDGFLLDNWLSGNRGPGFLGETECAAITFTGNRVEWNGGGGMHIVGRGPFSHVQITGCYFDRSGGPGITIRGTDARLPHFVITGNIIYRSGAPHWRELTEEENCQLLVHNVAGLVCTSNTFRVNPDDGMTGTFSPNRGIVFGSLQDSIIKDNVLHWGALKELLVDRGGHGSNVIVKDNVGSLHPTPQP